MIRGYKVLSASPFHIYSLGFRFCIPPSWKTCVGEYDFKPILSPSPLMGEVASREADILRTHDSSESHPKNISIVLL